MNNERELYDYDQLIAESDGLYRQWWLLWKYIHPEWTLIPEKEPAIPLPSKSKITCKKLSCKRCNHCPFFSSRLHP